MYGPGGLCRLRGRTWDLDSHLLSSSSSLSRPQRDGLRSDRECFRRSSSPGDSQHLRPLDSHALPGRAAYAGCVLSLILQPALVISLCFPSFPEASYPSPKSLFPRSLVHTDLRPSECDQEALGFLTLSCVSFSSPVIGALIGKQEGRNIEVMNSFELLSHTVEEKIIIDKEYYYTKEEQCERGIGVGRGVGGKKKMKWGRWRRLGRNIQDMG